MREQFEELPGIAKIIPKDSAFIFSEEDNCYFDYDETRRIEGFINGAYYAFQEQQKKIDKISEVVNGFRNAALILDTEYNEGAYRVCEMILDEIEDY